MAVVEIHSVTQALFIYTTYNKMKQIHRCYDWNCLIDEQSRQRVCAVAKQGIDAGKFKTGRPKYQTDWNFLEELTEDFINLKMSFIWSVCAFLSREVQIKKIESWCYISNKEVKEDRNNLWHRHNYSTISGIYYLHLPDDEKDLEKSGTEIAVGGINKTKKGITPIDSYFIPFKTGQWIIYPSSLYHRPGIIESSDNRFVIAADMYEI